MSNTSKISVTWIELLLVLLLASIGMGISTAAARLAEGSLSEREPKPEDFENSHGITAARRRQAASEEEWKATLSLRIKQHLEIERQSSQIAFLEQTFPDIRSTNPAANSVPAIILESYQKASQQKLAATLLEQRLDEQLHELEVRINMRDKAVQDASRAISNDFKSARIRFTQKRQNWTTILRIIGLTSLLVAAFVLLSSPTARRIVAHRGPTLAATALVLIILCFYDLLGAAFAAGFGALLALAGLGALLRSAPERASDG